MRDVVSFVLINTILLITYMGNGQTLTVGFLPIKQALLDPEVISVISASLFAPMVIPQINKVLDQIPFLRDHISLASLLAGVVLFGFVSSMKIPSIFKSVLIGICGAFILTAVLPVYDQITTRGSK